MLYSDVYVSCSLVSWVSADGTEMYTVCVLSPVVSYKFPDVLEVAKFQAGVLCSCRVERINPIRGGRLWVQTVCFFPY
jgi:hypothetical protein